MDLMLANYEYPIIKLLKNILYVLWHFQLNFLCLENFGSKKTHKV